MLDGSADWPFQRVGEPKAALRQFFFHDSFGDAVTAPVRRHPGRRRTGDGGRLEIYDRKPSAWTHRDVQRAVDVNWIGKMMIHIAKEDGVATIARQAGVMLRRDNRHYDPAGDFSRAVSDFLEQLRIDFSRVDLSSRLYARCYRDRDLTRAGAHVGNRRTRFEREDLREMIDFRIGLAAASGEKNRRGQKSRRDTPGLGSGRQSNSERIPEGASERPVRSAAVLSSRP